MNTKQSARRVKKNGSLLFRSFNSRDFWIFILPIHIICIAVLIHPHNVIGVFGPAIPTQNLDIFALKDEDFAGPLHISQVDSMYRYDILQ